eukprot:9212130-Alexandrium_andersonii.AAC.1
MPRQSAEHVGSSPQGPAAVFALACGHPCDIVAAAPLLHPVLFDAINHKWNTHYATGKQFKVNGFQQSTFVLHAGLKLMAYESNGKLINHFKPMYAMTVHKAQGMAINRPYSINEHKRMQHDM